MKSLILLSEIHLILVDKGQTIMYEIEIVNETHP